jgi:hypothetical protein
MIIAEKFRGPPSSGNGGYVGGVFAGLIDPLAEHTVEVTLRAPIPLDKAMTTEVTGDTAKVTDGDTLIAEVKPSDTTFASRLPPSWQAVAAAADQAYSLQKGLQDFVPGVPGYHPICFCCGAGNPDGLKVFVAPVADQVAAIWQTETAWADASGKLPAEFLWTAMDCPGQFAFIHEGFRTGLLGRMTARIHSRPDAGAELLVNAWTIRVEGKKHFAGSAIYDQQGNLCAEAVTLWIGTQPHPSASRNGAP